MLLLLRFIRIGPKGDSNSSSTNTMIPKVDTCLLIKNQVESCSKLESNNLRSTDVIDLSRTWLKRVLRTSKLPVLPTNRSPYLNSKVIPLKIELIALLIKSSDSVGLTLHDTSISICKLGNCVFRIFFNDLTI
jgi:hypothetical protein